MIGVLANLIFGCLAYVAFLQTKKYVEKQLQEVKNPRYKCYFQMKVTCELQNDTKLELVFEQEDIVLPFPPFFKMTVSDCLNPLPIELAGSDEGNKHDFKSFHCGPVEEIGWNNFSKIFTCHVAPFSPSEPCSENGIETYIRELKEVGWHLEGISKVVLGHRLPKVRQRLPL